MNTSPTVLANYACHTGEGPLWHPTENAVYWVDIPPGRLYRYDVATGTHKPVLELERALGGYTIQEDGSFLLFQAQGFISHWDGENLSMIQSAIEGERDGRFNDVIADPVGRVFCGTMPTDTHPGRLYRLDPDGRLTLVLADAGLSNGMGFSRDQAYFYHTDSQRRTITRYDYDAKSGDISNPSVIVDWNMVDRNMVDRNQDAPDSPHVPDGMTVDAQGNIWSAHWDGSRIVCHSPDGEMLQEVLFPVKKVSSLTFGGEDWTDVYVTTAGGHEPEENGALAGALFHLTLGVAGTPEFRSRLELFRLD